MQTKADSKNSTKNSLSYIEEKGGCDSAVLKKKYAVRITDNVKNSINGDVHNDPVAKQYIPQARELKILPQENVDPIGDDVHTPIKGIVHRYPDRVLYKPANVCAVYCRYCFRREAVGPGANILSAEERTAALNYIRANKEIWEVILTGGDPLVLSPRQLDETFAALDDISHVQTLRIHTRAPIADPDRITDDVIKTLKRDTPIYIVLHINHAQEITPKVEQALKKLRAAGCTLLSQSVLLKGVNDNPDTLEQLFKKLITLRVQPYYLHHPDMAPGTAHFRLSIKRGQEIMQELQGRISGTALPKYMLDIPGGHGKIQINSSYINENNNDTYTLTDPNGRAHQYPPKGSK